jgi:phosphoglycerate-specific signal transduction histidine kinase
MDRLQELKDLVVSFEKDFVKFYEKGNKSAGTRVRKHMNELKRKAQEIRKEVQERKAADAGTPDSAEATQA